MINSKESIPLGPHLFPSVTTYQRRRQGLEALEILHQQVRPEPFYPKVTYTKKGKAVVIPGKSTTVEGRQWLDARAAITSLIAETEKNLTTARQAARLRAKLRKENGSKSK
jgi:hypothetical protein